MLKNLAFVWEVAKIVIISLCIVIPIRYFLFQPFFVKGMSMEPNFDDGQYLIVDEITPKFDGYKRGEVIVFKFPQNPSQYYIKRIIGLPNEAIEFFDGKITIKEPGNESGFVLDEKKYLPYESVNYQNLKITLKNNEYFVLGDNREASADSRRWGTLPSKYIVGKVWLRAWPFDKFETIEAPAY
ncbi:MAG: signal peptidase I [Syntrophales bacterium]|nr:signal peptidase I [Syntrophales bacterium]